jgi:poly(A) polymerase Pap1
MPVQLQEMSKLTHERVAENPLWYDMDPNAVMPIISPGFIESNKASDIDQNTKTIINTIMSEGIEITKIITKIFHTKLKGLKQIREIRAGNMGWSDFMRGHDLGKKV